jgi:ArsR family transcriptional regulator, arsenate/arsenite/antimonite-responsive transcriptional repressor
MKKALPLIEQKQEGCCSSLFHSNLSSKQTEQAKNMFAALADETRLAILNLLAQSEGEVCVCDITASFTLHQPTISHHLKILREAGLIQGIKRGKWVHYSLVRPKIEEVKGLLDKVLAVVNLVS